MCFVSKIFMIFNDALNTFCDTAGNICLQQNAKKGLIEGDDLKINVAQIRRLARPSGAHRRGTGRGPQISGCVFGVSFRLGPPESSGALDIVCLVHAPDEFWHFYIQ